MLGYHFEKDFNVGNFVFADGKIYNNTFYTNRKCYVGLYPGKENKCNPTTETKKQRR